MKLNLFSCKINFLKERVALIVSILFVVLFNLFYTYLYFSLLNFESIIFFYLSFHILFLNPISILICKLRNWEPLEIIYTLKNPIIFKYIITSLVYPYVFLIIFGVLRYFALGKTITPYFINWDVEYFIFLTLFSLHILLILFKFKYYLSLIKTYYLKETYFITFSLHLYFLRNYYYRIVIEKITKGQWVLKEIFSKNSLIYPSWHDKNAKVSSLRKIVSFLYEKPEIFSLFVGLFVFLEVLYNKNMYYSSYLLFYYFLINLCATGLYRIGNNNFILDCCYSNYLNEKSWKNPYFPKTFASFCTTYLYYDYAKVKEIPEETLIYIEGLQDLAYKNTIMRYDGFKKLKFAVLKTNANMVLRSKIAFEALHKISWTQHTLYTKNHKRYSHTSTLANKLHPSTAFFFTEAAEKMALIKKASGWVAVHTQIQMVERALKPVRNPPKYAPVLDASITAQEPSSVLIKDLAEYNLKTSFNTIAQVGVAISSHIENKTISKPPQTEPDLLADFSKNTKYLFKGIIEIDQKSAPKGIASHNIINVSENKYKEKLYHFSVVLGREGFLHDQQQDALNLLAKISDDGLRKEHWCSVLHLFPLHRIPPLNTKTMIDSSNFTSETNQDFLTAVKQIEKVSNYLQNDFPNQRNRNWVEMKTSAQELKTANNSSFMPKKETLDLVIDFVIK